MPVMIRILTTCYLKRIHSSFWLPTILSQLLLPGNSKYMVMHFSLWSIASLVIMSCDNILYCKVFISELNLNCFYGDNILYCGVFMSAAEIKP